MRKLPVKRKKQMTETLLDRLSEKDRLKIAMTILAQRKSPAKAKAARENGKLGGRPRLKKTAA